jgi:DNA-binding MarR family transcriptional regulator
MSPSQDALLLLVSVIVSSALVLKSAGELVKATKKYREVQTVVRAVITTYGQKLAHQEETCHAISTELGRLKESYGKLEATQKAPIEFAKQTVAASSELTQALKETSVGIKALNEALHNREESIIDSTNRGEPNVNTVELTIKSNQEIKPTEIHTLKILATEGAKTSTQLHGRVGRSREHFARLMKRLYERGYVDRDTSKTPFVYKINERIAQKVLEAPEGSVRRSVE